MRTTIQAHQSWYRVDWQEIWEYRDLLRFMVLRDLTAIYKQSVLGPLWFVLQPLATTLVFSVIFGNIAKLGTDGIPQFMFYLSGMVLWNYFQGVMNGVANSLIGNAQIFGKVYFPRLIVPLSLATSNLAQFFLSFSMFWFFYLYFLFFTEAKITPTWWILALPLLVTHCGAIGLGVGLWLSAMTVKYRDLRFALPFLAQLWMFSTPIVYPSSLVSEKMHWILTLNPMAAVIEFTRFAFFNTGPVEIDVIIGSVVSAVVFLVSGVFIFNKVQRTFIDTI